MTPHADTELLSAYLDGEVPGAERAGLEQHLASCADCSARKSALEGVMLSVRELPPVTTTEAERLSIRRAVLDAAGSGASVRGLKRGRAWRVFAATAAVAAVFAGIVTIVAVRGAGPKVSTTASAPAPSVSPAVPNLANDADVRSYARSRPGVSTFLEQTQGAAAVPQAPLPLPASTQGPSVFGQLNPSTGQTPPATGQTKSAPSSDRALAPQGSATAPPTLGSCTRDTVPAGSALLEATPVTYQGTLAWVIAYGAPSGSTSTLDRVAVEVRSQSSCSVLDQATIP
jgi:hypothetical protein